MEKVFTFRQWNFPCEAPGMGSNGALALTQIEVLESNLSSSAETGNRCGRCLQQIDEPVSVVAPVHYAEFNAIPPGL
jgi:hypothetical protein